jgi:hypothetical protein
VVPKLYNSARIALENEDHTATDLSSWHCHIDNPEKRGQKLKIDAGILLPASIERDRKRK